VGRLATERRWKRVLIVTSTYHVVRAGILFKRCYTGHIGVVGARATNGPIGVMRSAIHEWGGVLYALAFARAC
jgi:uncharacterized SAM-binding protein YcdF (DUF218 family)